MKRISQSFQGRPSSKFSLLIIIGLLSCTMLSSCSWITSRRSLFGDEQDSADQGAATVPKSQFDALKNKYKALLKERNMENVQGEDANNMMNQMEQSSGNERPEDVVNKLSGVKSTAELAETVDVFSQQRKSSSRPSTPVTPLSTGNIDSALIEDHITKIRKAEKLVEQNKFDASINLIKELEKSPVRQVVVRAKYLMGEILFQQGEYDLAMQVFEEILQQHAFSGLVIKTLGKLIVCSEKLKVKSKQEKYYSILHDFFEQGA